MMSAHVRRGPPLKVQAKSLFDHQRDKTGNNDPPDQDIQLNDFVSALVIVGNTADLAFTESTFPWKEELECLAQ